MKYIILVLCVLLVASVLLDAKIESRTKENPATDIDTVLVYKVLKLSNNLIIETPHLMIFNSVTGDTLGCLSIPDFPVGITEMSTDDI